jgi:hypothetical protein
VVNLHRILLAVTDQRLRNLAVSPIGKRVDCWYITISRLG